MFFHCFKYDVTDPLDSPDNGCWQVPVISIDKLSSLCSVSSVLQLSPSSFKYFWVDKVGLSNLIAEDYLFYKYSKQII